MQKIKTELIELFENAKATKEFEFIQVLMNYKSMGSLRQGKRIKLSLNLTP